MASLLFCPEHWLAFSLLHMEKRKEKKKANYHFSMSVQSQQRKINLHTMNKKQPLLNESVWESHLEYTSDKKQDFVNKTSKHMDEPYQ